VGREHERTEAADTEDAGFDSLLRHAARLSKPVPIDPMSRLRPDSRLVGDRLHITRRLGAGGMGVVFEALDAGRHAKVALKTLNRLSAGDVYRLKNEFRSLADVVHPNLCRLYELFNDANEWFFTMELVDGVPFDDWVRPNRTLDEARLRAVLPQLGRAIDAIHDAGKLHRDLKPSNVLVTPEGRVVVLDFGLAVDPEPGGAGQTLVELTVSGTPGYMAPEQAAGAQASDASDRYAFGVMLFEALTGTLPFTGRILEMLTAKQSDPAPRARTLQADVPEDLDALCDALLVRDPAARMDGAALRAWFGEARDAHAGAAARVSDAARTGREGPRTQDVPTSAPPPSLAPASVTLLGRDDELSQLREAFRASCAGHKPVIVLVAGESGIGKSALCDTFLAELRASTSAVVLSGRCFERESVPFKAFDVVVDALSRYLRRLGSDAARMMPRDAFALHRIFPVLGRVSAIARAPQREVPDAHELRKRGFSAFAELLARMRERHPLIVHLDDLQWSDADSTLLLMHVLSQKDAPPVMWIVSHRSEQMEGHPHLSPLYRTLPQVPSVDVRSMALGPLSRDAARALLGTTLSGFEDEVGGNPFLLGELARHAALLPSEPAKLSVRGMLAARAAALPETERKLMEILAVASRPVDLGLAIEAAGVQAPPRTLFESLRDSKLARATGDGTRIECFHDKVREALLRDLTSERLRSCHAALASALGARPNSGAEELAVHLLGSGQLEAAAVQLARAADSALSELSFDRAARLYAQALEHGRFDSAETRRIRTGLGDALTYAGRGAQAAAHYFAAASLSDADTAHELERRAAEQLLISGRRKEGLATLARVLEHSDVAALPSGAAAIPRLLVERLRLRVAGLKFEPREAARIDPRVLRRVDACGVAARTLTVREPLLGAVFGTMHLRLALAAGEPTRIVEGLATEIMYGATEGVSGAARVEQLIACARALELTRAEPHAQAYFTTALAAHALLTGRFAEAAESAAEADEIYRERCTGVTGPLNLARCIWAPATLFLGEVPRAMGPLTAWLQDAREREDLEAEGQLGVYRLYGPLAEGDSAAVREGIQPMLARWRPDSREPAGMTAVHVLAVLEFYERGSPAALAKVLDLYDLFFRSFMTRVQLYRVVVMGYCANLELAIAAQGHDAAEHLRRAERYAVRLAREKVRYADALSHLARAGVAHQRGDDATAIRELERSCHDFEADRQMLWAACVRLRLARLLGGADGATHRARATQDMSLRGVAHPDQFVNVYAPGYAD
jgi:hypothetical protein